MQSAIQIRESFLLFFKNNHYKVLPTSSLIPKNDLDLLFINSGMAPFKDYFLGHAKPENNRWVTCQKCMRAGGKHNDLNQIGYSNYHHTLFEMLGNFEINSSQPDQVIDLAWRFIVQELKLSKSRLSVSVLQGDDHTESLWKKFLPENRIHRATMSHNFWQMGDTGPCGPCTEIFYTPDVKSKNNVPLEIWNLVFVKYRLDEQHNRKDLPCVSIDTGMGLERITAVVQGVFDNYKTDIFKQAMETVSRYAEHKCALADINKAVSIRIIVDHMRAAVFLIAEGLLPINLGRGYVLRRILRRALFHMHNLIDVNQQEACLQDLVTVTCNQFVSVYPKMQNNIKHIITVIIEEKHRFERTLQQGYQFLTKHLQSNKSSEIVDGEFVFKLYDTYGFPVEAARDVICKKNKSIDMQAFDLAMQKQVELARRARKHYSLVFLSNKITDSLISLASKVQFVGFEQNKVNNSRILAFIHDNEICSELHESRDLSYVVVDQTPFYAEAGGQVGDTGKITGPQGQFMVTDTIKLPGLPLSIIVHVGYVIQGKLSVVDLVDMQIDEIRRRQIMRNHSCTHILSRVLHDKFQAEQMGSLVLPDRLRFDFSLQTKITSQDQMDVERLVNQAIWQNNVVHTEMMSLANARRAGVRFLRNEKYPDPMRVVTMKSREGKVFSLEACGGTHVSATTDIGLFVIHGIEAVSAGVKRIEASTREFALMHLQNVRTHMLQASQVFNVPMQDVGDKIDKLVNQNQINQKNLQKLDMSVLLACHVKEKILSDHKRIQIRYHELHSNISLSGLARALQQSFPGIHVVLLHKENKYNILISVQAQMSNKLSALQILRWLQNNYSANGNGSSTLAQGGMVNLSASIHQMIDACLEFIVRQYDGL